MLRAVELPGGVCDVGIRDGRVAEIGTDLLGATVIDGHGGALLPGLHDHHLHLHAIAAAAGSVRCGPPQVHTAGDLAHALATAAGQGWVRGVGYVETVAGLLDRDTLDRLSPARPVRIQHRSGAVWFLNSAAVESARLATADHVGVERDASGRPTGRVWRADAWLRERLPPADPPDIAPVGADLARYGITGVTDATPDLASDSLASLLHAHANGALPQRLHLLGIPLGEYVDGSVTTGPYKIVVADSDLPDYTTLSDTIAAAHSHGRPVAVHCVTREALLLLLAVFDDVGTRPGDRIEHAALVPSETVDRLRPLCVVTQPGFIADRGDDYAQRVDAEDLPDLYRCRTLLDAGVRLALSSDAPHGPLDPWAVIAAAATRRTRTGRTLGESERIGTADALDRYLAPLHDPGGPARRVTVGAPADLVLLDRPLAAVLRAPSAEYIRHTLVRGHVRSIDD